MNVSLLNSSLVNEMIMYDGEKCDTDTEKSDKESVKSDKEDSFYTEEEVKNKYSFLETFKKTRKNKIKKVTETLPLVEEKYHSD